MSAKAASAPLSPLSVERLGAVAHLVLDDPASRNALSDAMMAALASALSAIAADDDIRIVVISATGPVYCSGHHLKEMTARRADPNGGRAAFTDVFARCSALMQQIITLPQPVIAAVEGMATAAGCQLVASCDLAIAGTAARFCTPGVHIGLFCSTPMVALSRNVAPKAAMRMLLTGDMVGAAQAAAMGLINEVVPEGAALAEALALAGRIAQTSGLALRMGKAAFYTQLHQPLPAAYASAAAVMVDNMLTHDASEGIEAFLMKRKPVWENR